MTGPEHYREAERLLVRLDGIPESSFAKAAEAIAAYLTAAQVHATLALAAVGLESLAITKAMAKLADEGRAS